MVKRFAVAVVYDVLQLPDVARPGVRQQQRLRILRKSNTLKTGHPPIRGKAIGFI